MGDQLNECTSRAQLHREKTENGAATEPVESWRTMMIMQRANSWTTQVAAPF